jgi:hypothetical protein
MLLEVGQHCGEWLARPGVDVGRHGLAEQEAEIFETVARQREEGFEEQVLEQVVAPDVDDEGDRRTYELDVREVLIGADPEVYASVRADLAQLACDLEVGLLVGDDVVGIEIAAGLREARNERGKGRRVGERRGRALRADRRRRGDGSGEAGNEDAASATSRRA